MSKGCLIEMNYKLEKFWNKAFGALIYVSKAWTINLKSFEIICSLDLPMWTIFMNYKLEKFWNYDYSEDLKRIKEWTINLKSFEILHSGVKAGGDNNEL